MPKQVNIDKVKAEFDKCNLDEQINAFRKLKGLIDEKIFERVKDLDNEKEKYLTVKEKL